MVILMSLNLSFKGFLKITRLYVLQPVAMANQKSAIHHLPINSVQKMPTK